MTTRQRLFLASLGLAATVACGRLAADDTDGSVGDAHVTKDATSLDGSDGGQGDAAGDAGVDGAPSCPPGGTLCNGTCFDLQTDTLHCGACSKDCQGTKCVAGACTPILIQSANPRRLALDATHVYWTNPGVYPPYGQVLRTPKTGGQLPTQLASNQNEVFAIAIDANDLYWSVGGAIEQLPLGGGTPSALASVDTPWSMVLDSTHVYWGYYYGQGEVGVTTLADGGTTILAAGRTNAVVGGVDSSYVYWSENGGVMRVPIAGGSIDKLASIAVSSPLAIDANNLYWIDPGTAQNGYDDGAVMQMPLGGGTPITLVSNVKHWVTSIAVDATDVYWTFYGTQSNNYADGQVNRVPIGGGTPTALATNQMACFGIVLDATHLYWIDANPDANGWPGYIMKLAK